MGEPPASSAPSSPSQLWMMPAFGIHPEFETGWKGLLWLPDRGSPSSTLASLTSEGLLPHAFCGGGWWRSTWGPEGCPRNPCPADPTVPGPGRMSPRCPTFQGHLDGLASPSLLCPGTSCRAVSLSPGPDQGGAWTLELLKPTPRTEHAPAPCSPPQSAQPRRKALLKLPSAGTALRWGVWEGAAPPQPGLGARPPCLAQAQPRTSGEARGLAGRTALSPHTPCLLMSSLISCQAGFSSPLSAAINPVC